MTEPAKPGVMERLRARFRWFDRVMRAQERYNESKGDFYAAGITYFTIFALFPLLMVGFAAGGFVLANRPELLAEIESKIKSAVSGDLGQQLINLMDSAIDSRTSVGLIGLATAAWAGLGWMANLREALSQMWGCSGTSRRASSAPSSRIWSRCSRLFVAIVVTVALTALGNGAVMRNVLEWFGVPDFPALGALLRVASVRGGPRRSPGCCSPGSSPGCRGSPSASAAPPGPGCWPRSGSRSSSRSASVYLSSVLHGPAGATFGPVLGLMVFAYVTARLILFATAWAATSSDNLAAAPVGPPGAASITTRVQVREGLGVRGALAAAAVGALGALGLSRLNRRRP